jgi:hypothetical protein
MVEVGMAVQKVKLPKRLGMALKAVIRAVGAVAPDDRSNAAVLASRTVQVWARLHGPIILVPTRGDWKVRIMASSGFAGKLHWAGFVSCWEDSVLAYAGESADSRRFHDALGAREVSQVFQGSLPLAS